VYRAVLRRPPPARRSRAPRGLPALRGPVLSGSVLSTIPSGPEPAAAARKRAASSTGLSSSLGA
jgi:hypothetical protein